MVLAVVHRDAHVLDWKASERAFAQHLAHALFHRRNVLARDGAAHHVVDELEAGAATERFDAQVHLAELPRPAGLLLVPAMALGRTGDGLAVGNARRVRLHVHAVALSHALEQHAQMEFTHAVEHRLVNGGVVLDPHARIFRGELVERVGESLLVAAPLRLDGHAEHGRRIRHGLQVVLVLVVRVVQHRVQVQLIDLGDGTDVPGHRRGDLARVLAEQPEQMGDLDRLARIAHEQLTAGANGSLMHAQHPELADVGIDGHLEHVRDHVPGRIRGDCHTLGALARALEEGRRVSLRGVRHQALEHLQQLRHPGATLRGGETHRHQMPLAQRLLEGVVQLLGRELLALLQVQRHELLVELDDLIDDLRVRRLD